MLADRELLARCEVTCYRASGPGGQKRNKTASAVRLRHAGTGLIVIAEESRSQHENRRRALRRLRRALALHCRCRIEDAGAARRLIEACRDKSGRLALGRRDERFWPLVAEVLDVFAAQGARVRETAEALGMSTAALVRLFEADPQLWKQVNEMRRSAGQRPLRRR